MRTYFVYILASRRHGVLYTGITRDLALRVEQHRHGFSKFTTRYNVQTLVWFEVHHDVLTAIEREKKIKHWRRAWKVALIEARNPEWLDLYPQLRG